MKEATTVIDIDMLEKVANRISSLSHPSRVGIVELLQEKEKLSVTEIHNQLKMEQAVVSNHLKILKGIGVLGSKRDGKKIIYSVKPKVLKTLLDTITKCNNA
jgi:ArsR family transcriptional regulator